MCTRHLHAFRYHAVRARTPAVSVARRPRDKPPRIWANYVSKRNFMLGVKFIKYENLLDMKKIPKRYDFIKNVDPKNEKRKNAFL